MMQQITEIPSAKEQKEKIKEVFEKPLQENDTWYVLSYCWWRQWVNFTCWDNDNDSTDEEIKIISEKLVPPAIDNSDIIVHKKRTSLRQGLQEKLDYVLITDKAWELLYKWYGGGPEIPRKVIEVGTKNRLLRIDLYPITPVFRYSQEKQKITLSRSYNIQTVKKLVYQVFPSLNSSNEVCKKKYFI
jgi:ubiquitin carboxyl-terminal hydrolase 4/11/15